MSMTILGISFSNPIIAASTDIARSPAGFWAFAASGIGGIITKSVTDAAALQQASISRIHITDMNQVPVKGRLPDHYVFFSRGGSMLSMEQFEAEAPELLAIGREYGVVVIGSISASRTENWITYAKRLEAMGFPAIELNFGNPHGEATGGKLGFLIGQSKNLSAEIAAQVVKAVSIPVIVKLTPQNSDLLGTVQALEQAGVQAVTITHRFQGLMLDPQTDRPVLGGWAAIGGPWMKPISLANVARVCRGTKLVVWGSNGVDTPRDIYDYLLAGASLVEVGSSMMLRGPAYAKALVDGFQAILHEKDIENPAEIIGQAARQITPYQKLSQLPTRSPVINFQVCAQCPDMPCLSRCYFGGLEVQDGALVHHDQACSGCGMCAHVCPYEAVYMEEKSKGDCENEAER